MLRRRTLVNLTVFLAIAGFFVYWAATNILSFDFIEKPYHVSADFQDAMGVLPNAEVTYLGKHVGLVQHVRLIPDGVRVAMKIDRGEKIPASVTAHIHRKSALGEQYVDFSNPPKLESGGPVLHDGSHIPESRTTVPIEFSELLRSADRLLTSIDPSDLRTITHELALGLQGRGGDLRSLADESTKLSRTFASRTETLDRLATNNTRLTHVMAAHSASLVDAVHSLRQVVDSLSDVRTDFQPLIDNGTTLLDELVPLVHDHRDSLSCLLDAVGKVIDISTTPARLEGLATLLEDMPTATDQLLKATDIEAGPDGRQHQWVRVDLTSGAQSPAPDFQPNKATPPNVPAIPACDVSFADAAPPPPAPESPTGATPATGGTLGVGTALGLLVLWVLAFRIRPRIFD